MAAVQSGSICGVLPSCLELLVRDSTTTRFVLCALCLLFGHLIK